MEIKKYIRFSYRFSADFLYPMLKWKVCYNDMLQKMAVVGDIFASLDIILNLTVFRKIMTNSEDGRDEGSGGWRRGQQAGYKTTVGGKGRGRPGLLG